MNLPNKLTLFRIIMIPVFIFFSAEISGPVSEVFGRFGADGFVAAFNRFTAGTGQIIAGVVFVVAFATDALDGYIARKYNLVTDFGIFLDPIADKLLVAAALIVLCSRGITGVWIPVIIISREIIVTGLRLLAVNKGIVLAAGGFGKAKTVTQFVSLTLLLFNNFNIAPLRAVNAGLILLYAAFVITVLSGADYLFKNRELLKTR